MHAHATANDRLKETSRRWIWSGISIAVVLHFLLLAFWPAMSLAEMAGPEQPMVVIPTVEPPLPEAPVEIRRPSEPVLSSDPLVSDEITIPPTTTDAWADPLPSPPPVTGGPRPDFLVLGPMMVRPELTNRDEVIREMERIYPPVLRAAGVGGRTVLTLYLDAQGRLHGAEIAVSSGQPQLDAAALRVIDVARFRPALNRDRAVAVRLQWAIDWKPAR